MARISASDMRRTDWIANIWIEVTEVGDTDTMYLLARPRPIEEAKEAAEQFDIWMQAKQEIKKRLSPNIYGGFPIMNEMEDDCILKGK